MKKKKKWFTIYKKIISLFFKKPEFIFLGEEVDKKSIILSNHVGKNAPVVLELYFKKDFRFWGTHEMNGGLKEVYKYMTNIFYHKKQGWPLWLAKLFCLIAAPLANLFYKGIQLISTYPDYRLLTTFKETIATLNNDYNIVIFPEDSSNGYFDILTKVFAGFVTLGDICLKKNMDLPIFLAYYKKKEKKYIFDKPIMFSELIKNNESKEVIAERIKDRINELATLEI